MLTSAAVSVAILAQAISCSNVHGVIPVTSFSGFVLSKCLQPSFVVLHLFSWHVRATEQMCLHLGHQPPLRIWSLLTVLFLTLKGQDFGPVQSTKSTNSYHSSYKTRPGSRIASRRLLRQWPPRRLRLQIFHKLLGVLWLASLLWKQMQLLGPVALTRQDLGTCLDSNGSSDDNRNTRRT